ncbi:MAG: FGGY family carbohydrate kinase [Bacillota bacterium]|nr:FGGY family carbohydrate kinase [Bacillota bacterium]
MSGARGKERYVAAFDFGTGGGRCAIFDLAGRRVGLGYRPWRYRQPDPADPSVREFDPALFWAELCQALAEARQQAGVEASQIAAVSATGQREGIVLLDEAGRELYAGPNIDYRGRDGNRWLAEHLGEEIYRRSGHWPEGFFAPGRLWWLRQRAPELFQRARHLLTIPDWILFRLSGAAVSEPTAAVETLLWDLETSAWNTSLLARLEIPPHLCPPLATAGRVVGRVTEEAARQTGLAPGTPVVAGGADTQCALLGAGVLDPGSTGVVSGTTTPIQLVTARPVLDPRRRTWTCPHLLPGRWVVEANARLTGLVFRWLRDSFYGGLDPRAAEELMLEEAESAGAGAGGTFAFLGPVISCASAPQPERSLLWGLRPEREGGRARGQVVRAFLENIAYAVRANVELAELIGGLVNTRVVLTGGGSRHPLLPRLVAAVLGRSITVAAESESAALGAAICAAAGAGCYPDLKAAAAAMVQPGRSVSPEEISPGGRGEGKEAFSGPEAARSGSSAGAGGDWQEYQELYRRWRKLYDELYLAGNRLELGLRPL